MPEPTRDDYRPSAALSDQPWHLPSTLSRSLERQALVGASSLAAPPVDDKPATTIATPRPPATPQNVWSDITIAHDSDEVRGDDELDDALDLVRPPVRPTPAQRATARSDGPRPEPAGPQTGSFGQAPTQASLQGIAGTFQQMVSQAGGQPQPGRVAARRAPARTNRPGEQSGGGRLVGTLVVLGIIVKILLEVLRATGH